MRRSVAIVLAAVLAAALVVSVSAFAAKGKGKRKHGQVVTVIAHATTGATTDTGPSGDSAGDILTFGNDVFDSADANKVGTDQGSCVRIVPGESYECMWTTFLPKGQITVEGPFYDRKDSTLAITGGTGRYRNARGQMDLQSREGGSKFAFVFHIIG
jgi:type II secretory pathway pseudopilin PulG